MVVLLDGLASLASKQKDEAIAIEAYGFWGGGLNDCLLWGRRKVRRFEISRDSYVRLRGVAVDAPSWGSSHRLPGSRFSANYFLFVILLCCKIFNLYNCDSLFMAVSPRHSQLSYWVEAGWKRKCEWVTCRKWVVCAFRSLPLSPTH